MLIKISQVEMKELPVIMAKSTLYKWAKAGRFPHVFKKFGGMVLVDMEGLKLLLKEQSP